MARRPLYPRTPGETAIDRLLNQTLPNIIKEESARNEREELREEEKARYRSELAYKVARDTKTDQENFDNQYNQYYSASLNDKETKNFDGANIDILQSIADKSRFTTDLQLESITQLRNDLKKGQEFSDKIDMGINTINDTSKTKIEKFSAFVDVKKNIALYGTEQQKRSFKESYENSGDDTLAFITANQNILGVIGGQNTSINTAFDLSDKIDSGMSFRELDSDDKEAFLPYLSAQDQERFKSPISTDPNYASERDAALRSAFLRTSSPIFNEEGNEFLDKTIADFGGAENFEFTHNFIKENQPIVFRSFVDSYAKAGDLATRGTAGRLEAAQKGQDAEEEYITQYLEEKGFKRSLFDLPPKDKITTTETEVVPFKDEFDGLSNREVIKRISDENNVEPIFSRTEQYFLDQIEKFERLQEKKKDPSTPMLTASEENEFQRIRTLIVQFPQQYKKLTDQRYLNRRGAGKYVVGQTGFGNVDLENRAIKRTTPIVKTGLKLVKGIEDAEVGIQALKNTLESARLEGDRYVVTDPAALEALRVTGVKKGIGGVIKRFPESKIRAAIAKLEKDIVAAEKKLPGITSTLKTKFDLFKNYNLIEIINQSEDGTARDISYMIRKQEG